MQTIVIAISLIVKTSDNPEVSLLGGIFTSVGIAIGTVAIVLYQINRLIERDRDRRGAGPRS
ncbi:hypothetical protein [Nonomuraea turcica]|uniref:hypothetical protein n=1 Tax=Nonomuraea sp. G32 TaxID=3067274 RepID=UPI00273C45D6|nr:hypothetical protein [Nonomuraea sp. G32]MDP4511397.1 hypothetical protein [Nonomuraea sp. G32]